MIKEIKHQDKIKALIKVTNKDSDKQPKIKEIHLLAIGLETR